MKTIQSMLWGLVVISFSPIVRVVDWHFTTQVMITTKTNTEILEVVNHTTPPSVAITPRSNTAPHQDVNITVPHSFPVARAFPVWNRSATTPYNWCHKEEGPRSGILYVKVDKCASTTGSGVSIRIADTLGRRLMGTMNEHCFTRHSHGRASAGLQQYLFRDTDRSLLWTTIRQPAPRVMSAFFFFEVSRNGVNATEQNILDFVGRRKFKTYMLDYVKLKNFTNREEEIRHVIQNYDFIAVAERMPESLVVMSMILKVPLADLIVLSAKADEYDDGMTAKGCIKLTRAWRTPKVDEYLAGEFLQDNYDMIFYRAVNASLDLTIDALGRDLVTARVSDFYELVEKNKRECSHKAIFPCPLTLPNHTMLSLQNCYRSDAGCGHRCTDIALRAESDDEWTRLTMSG
ncbi:sulfotransferase family [Fragilaria crotonensis]|nr:sulfotransferase family [Fragilaria crotonensis]